ncbi:MAG: Asp-tRNA(Asn)/Glu-tRNA(Gln) amidotransferase subunit GatA [Chitinophagaceae bacterium]|nr:Asp-tRNA(Asn)/Glu-tRNA(Gln) amidotransferase subunit GatA [Chitinophagaceae bacterium]
MFLFKTIKQYHNQLVLDEVDCITVVEHYLKKIKGAQNLNAFIEVFDKESLQRARELDTRRKNGESLGPLHGVVVAIKDVICYKDHEISAASNILKGFTSLYNSTAVKKLLEADAIIIGNCNCDEFAMGSTNENSCYGKVLNALDETKVPGGSSGGSAVAVQAGLCMLSLGSDTGGSVRQPADFCGIIGFKPGYGRISRYGLIAYASSFDQIGIFGNTIEDVALAMEVITGEDEYDSTVSSKEISKFFNIPDPVKKPVVAYFKNALDHHSLDQEIKNQIYRLIEKMKKDGFTVEPLEFEWLEYVVPTYYVLTTAEASSNLSRYDGIRFGPSIASKKTDLTNFYTTTRSNGFGKEVKRRIMLGTFVLSAGYYDAYFTKAQQVRRILCEQTKSIFKKYDALIIPTVTSTAFNLDEISKDPIAMYLADIYTVYANLVGIPGISVPLFKHSDGLPFGLQIMSNKCNELSLLRFSDLMLKNYKQYS